MRAAIIDQTSHNLRTLGKRASEINNEQSHWIIRVSYSITISNNKSNGLRDVQIIHRDHRILPCEMRFTMLID